MNLINQYFFIGSNNVPNTNYEEVVGQLDALISEKQAEYLKAILGEQLYPLFLTGLTETPVDAKWVAIRDGLQYYSANGLSYKWEGLNNSTSFLSPLADYVYYYWLRDNVTQSTGIGEVKPEGMNSSAADSRRKQANAWNRMVQKNIYLHDYLLNSPQLYPSFWYFKTSMTKKTQSLLTKINPFGI